MENAIDLLPRIQAQYPTMSKGYKRIADYILSSYDKAAFMTAAQLAAGVDVSESTVVRFAYALGYQNYQDLRKSLQMLLRQKMTSLQRMDMAPFTMQQGDVLGQVLKADINNLRETMELVDESVVGEVVARICEAKHIYILGLRSSAPLAQFMGYYFHYLFENVHVVSSGVGDVLEQMIRIQRGDVLLGISFPRYASHTVKAMEFASAKEAYVVSITDSLQSPIAPPLSDACLLAKNDMLSFVDSLVAPLSVINGLIVAVSLQKRAAAEVYLNELEPILTQYRVYDRKE